MASCLSQLSAARDGLRTVSHGRAQDWLVPTVQRKARVRAKASMQHAANDYLLILDVFLLPRIQRLTVYL